MIECRDDGALCLFVFCEQGVDRDVHLFLPYVLL
jgi:hypothetical protein